MRTTRRGLMLAGGAAFGLAAGPAAAAADPVRARIYPHDSGWPEPGPWRGAAPQAVAFHTGDGLNLSSWFWPGTTGRVLIFFHGNGGNQTVAAHYVEALHARGDAVLLAAYRGYGGNPGEPSEAGLTLDGAAALAFAEAQGFAPEKIFLIGYSLGGAVALKTAADRPLGGVVTLGAFTSLKAASPKWSGWLLPDRWDNLASVRRLKAPLVVFHGTADETVPYAQGKELFAAAAVPKRFASLTGAPHRPDMDRLAPFILQAVDALATGDPAGLGAGAA